MTKILSVADVHLGVPKRLGGPLSCGMNRRTRDGLAVLRAAANAAINGGADAFIVVGDLFDSSRPPPQLIAAVQDILVHLAMKVILLVGNHDQESDAEGDHALGPLAPYATVIERPTMVWVDRVQLACLPHRRGRRGSWIREELGELELRGRPDTVRVLALHAGVVDGGTPSFLRSGAVAADELADACRERGVYHAFAGDHHNHRSWTADVRVLQLGALCPTGWDNPGLDGYGTVACFDSDTDATTIAHLPGPRFIKTGAGEPVYSLGDLSRLRDAGHRVYAEFVARAGTDGATERALTARLVREGLLVDGDVSWEDGESSEPARDAAEEVRVRSSDLGAALAAFVEKMPLPEGVAASDVFAAAQAHLAAGKRSG